MKFYILTLHISLCFLNVFGQPKKLYANAKGKLTDNPKDAAFYYLVEKKNDSTFVTSKFDLDDKIVLKGIFVDETIKIPNGSFTFYSREPQYVQLNRPLQKAEPYLATTGSYLNGKKSGEWIDYYQSGGKMLSLTYEKNKLNGPYKEYYGTNGQLSEEGNYVNDKKEGDVIAYTKDGLYKLCTFVYSHNSLLKTVFHTKAPVAPKNFDKYIEKATDPFLDYLKTEKIYVKLLINEQGKVDSVISYNKQLDQNVLDIVNKALLNSPNFIPGIINDIACKQLYLYNFNLGTAHIDISDPNQTKRDRIYSNHANDIGRGLNSVGFGTPVEN